MRKEYDFSEGDRGAVTTAAKTRITIYLDNEILTAFRARSAREGKGYQTLINDTLRAAILEEPSMDAKTIRRIIREELARTGS